MEARLHRSAITKFGYGLWLFVAIAVTAKITLKGVEKSVYPIFANASENWWSDLSLYAYYPNLDIYRYPPIFAIIFTPLTFDVFWGHLIWVLGSYAVLFFAAYKFYFEFSDINPKGHDEQTDASGLFGWFLILTALGSVRSVWNGQSNILLIALILLGLVALCQRRWWLCALLLMSAAFIKVWPVILCGILVTHFPRQLFSRFVVIGIVLLGFPFVTNSPEVVLSQYTYWIDSLLNNQLARRWPGFRDAWTIWEELIGPINVNIYFATQAITGLIILILTASLGGHTLKKRIFYILCAWLCWQLLFGPGTERATYSILAPMFALAVVTHKDRLRPLLAVSGVLYLVFTHGSFERLALQVFPAAKILIPTAAVVLFTWLLLQIIFTKSPKTADSPSSIRK
jgi:hypothetical protein